MRGSTILFAEMIPDADWEDRFNKWYDTHHMPARMAAPGFISAQRYRDPERLNYLAVYELASAAFQVAIVLASASIITSVPALAVIAGLVGATGFGLGVLAYFPDIHVPHLPLY